MLTQLGIVAAALDALAEFFGIYVGGSSLIAGFGADPDHDGVLIFFARHADE